LSVRSDGYAIPEISVILPEFQDILTKQLLRGYFLRGVSGGSGRDPNAASRAAMATGGATGNVVGSVQLDAIQNITGTFGLGESFATSLSGAFASAGTTPGDTSAGGSLDELASFDASRVVRTSTETRPLNAYVNYIIKY
jgi:hypothetical protein